MHWLLLLVPVFTVLGAASNSARGDYPPLAKTSQWSGWGGNIHNNRWAQDNKVINSSNTGSLSKHCSLPYKYGVSASPTIDGENVYFPTWNGLFVSLDYLTCEIQWQLNVTRLIVEFGPISKDATIFAPISRSSPQIDGEILYFTTLTHCLLVAIERKTGSVMSTVQINPHPLAIGTMSPTVYKGRVFVGASSAEENAAGFVAGYKCCSFNGNMAAFDFNPLTGRFTTAWNVSMVPPNHKWAGGSVWGSQPSIDIKRSQVFIGTGGVYNIPGPFQDCLKQAKDIEVVQNGTVSLTCIPKGLLQDAVVALDIDTGFINWVQQLRPLDPWTYACGTGDPSVPRNKTLCPYDPGPDANFGMAPTFVPGSESTPHGLDTVVVGQKNGQLHSFFARSGAHFWSTQTSPHGISGGLIWGIAVDDSQVYFTAVNSNLDIWKLHPSGNAISNSAFGAASLKDGSVLWEIASPRNSTSSVPPTVVNDVVFFGRGSEDVDGKTPGGLIPIHKNTGKIIRDYPLDTNFHGGIGIQDKFVMFGTGYRGTATYTKNGSFEVWKI